MNKQGTSYPDGLPQQQQNKQGADEKQTGDKAFGLDSYTKVLNTLTDGVYGEGKAILSTSFLTERCNYFAMSGYCHNMSSVCRRRLNTNIGRVSKYRKFIPDLLLLHHFTVSGDLRFVSANMVMFC